MDHKNSNSYKDYLFDLDELAFAENRESRQEIIFHMIDNEYYIKQSDFYVDIARIITRARMEKGLSQQELADMAGTNRDFVANLAKIARSGFDDARSHDAYTLARIMIALGHDLGEVTIIK